MIFYWPAMFVATHWPRLDLGSSNVWWSNDKFLHCGAFALLAFLLGLFLGLGGREPSARPWKIVLGVVLVVGLYGVIDERTQPYFWRSADIRDWTADMVGCAIGLAAAATVNVVAARPAPLAREPVACERD